MSITARYTKICPECQRYIVTGKDEITRLHPQGHTWVHEECHTKFWTGIKQEKLRQEEQETNAIERNT